jgi:hypothetical protein
MHSGKDLAHRVFIDVQRDQFLYEVFLKLEPFELTRNDCNYSLVEQAMRIGIGERRAV